MRKLWRPVELEFARHIATNEGAEAHLRLYFLALIRNRGDGHAHFERGELTRLLGVGESVIDRRDVAKVIKAAAKRGLVRADSNAQCVWLPRGHDHRAGGKELTDHYPCEHHRKARRRSARRTDDPTKALVRRTDSPTSTARRRTDDPTLEGIVAGQEIGLLSSSTAPSREPQPEASEPTPRPPHLRVIAS